MNLFRKFRKVLRSKGRRFPLTGSFAVLVNGNRINHPSNLPDNLDNLSFDIFTPIVLTPVQEEPEPQVIAVFTPPVVEEDRILYKKSVREADPNKPGSKRRIDYRVCKNPKADETYYIKIDGKWKPVPAAAASPSYQIAV